MGEGLRVFKGMVREEEGGKYKACDCEIVKLWNLDLNAMNLTNVKKKLTTSIYGAIHLLDALFPLSLYNIIYFNRDKKIFLIL